MSCANTCLLDYDNAPCIPIASKVDTSIQFSLFYPDPIDLSSGTFTFVLSKDERGQCPVLTVAEGEGLTVEAGTLGDDSGYYLSVFIPKDHGLSFGDYYGEVRNDIDDENASIILKVTLEIRPSIARMT